CCVCARRDQVTERIESRDWGYGTTDEKIIYLRCGRCDHLFLDRIPGNAADIAALYPPEYGAYSRSSFGFFGMAARRFAASVKASASNGVGRSIDSATEFGPGANPLVSRQWLPADCDVSYVDVQPSDQLPRDARVIRATAEDGVGLIPDRQGLIVA